MQNDNRGKIFNWAVIIVLLLIVVTTAAWVVTYYTFNDQKSIDNSSNKLVGIAGRELLTVNRPKAVSTQEDIQNYVNAILADAKIVRKITLGEKCVADTVAAKVSWNEKMTFENGAKVVQELIIGPKKYNLQPGAEVILEIKDIVISTSTVPRGTTVRQFRCVGVKGIAGYLAILPN